MESIGMLILRLTLGLIFVAHGLRQFFGWFGGGGMEDVIRRLGLRPAKLWASLAGLGNLCGGIMITLGAFTFLGCALIITTMLVAMLTIKAHSGFWERYSGYEMKLGAGIQRFGNARELYRRQGGSRRLQQIFGLGSGLPRINVNVVAPGLVASERVRAMFSEEQWNKLVSARPMGRAVLPEEVASAIFFLVQDNQASITGQTLHVNGGAFMV